MVTHNPSMLDVQGLRAAMEEAARIMPQLDVHAQVRRWLRGLRPAGGGARSGWPCPKRPSFDPSLPAPPLPLLPRWGPTPA